jgi:hypothetical protein
MVVYVIPAAVVVIAFLLIFAGGAWVVGNFLIGMIPILIILVISIFCTSIIRILRVIWLVLGMICGY